VSVLGTAATVKREYTRALIRDFGRGCDVTLVGSAQLASIAEAALHEKPVDDADIAREIAPCLVDRDGRRTDTIVLACIRFPLLLDRLQRLMPWPVDWIDPAPAIARRVSGLIGAPAAAGQPAPPGRSSLQGLVRPPCWPRALARFGLKDAAQAAGSSAGLSSQPASDTTGPPSI
jgi:glutamate racemase